MMELDDERVPQNLRTAGVVWRVLSDHGPLVAKVVERVGNRDLVMPSAGC
jgi:hypothetical protein